MNQGFTSTRDERISISRVTHGGVRMKYSSLVIGATAILDAGKNQTLSSFACIRRPARPLT